jgi:hypothetical protein
MGSRAMKFVLTIQLGNEAMETRGDALEAIQKSFARYELTGVLDLEDEANIRDTNGNNVGSWKVVE